MMESSLASLASATITVVIALIFARAALHKLTEFTEFTGFVNDYRVVSERLVRKASIGIVTAEIAVVVLQLLPGGRLPGLAIAAGMFALYALAMGLEGRAYNDATPTEKRRLCAEAGIAYHTRRAR